MSTASPLLRPLLAKVAEGEALSFDEAADAFEALMAGEAGQAQVAGLLMALRVRGETVDELRAGAMALRRRMLKVQAPEGAIDVVGTGGDASGTWNISTASAFVVAGCGVPVAKHGNRGVSSRSGSADVLTALGVDIEAPTETVERAIAQAGIGFMMAPRHHGAMRHVAPARAELGTRTIFNLLGPLANPAGVKRQVTGVFAERWLEPMAQTLGELGAERAWVVHGEDGLDELTTTGVTHVAAWDGEAVSRFTVTPEQAGLPRAVPGDLRGGEPADNARAIRAVLGGAPGPLRNIAVLGAAAALVVAGRSADLMAGARLAEAAIDAGRARACLERLVQVTTAVRVPG